MPSSGGHNPQVLIYFCQLLIAKSLKTVHFTFANYKKSDLAEASKPKTQLMTFRKYAILTSLLRCLFIE